jgi:very-short-patch-repair endonuclease
MTEAEKILWKHLRGRRQGCKYRRQVPLGLYIADFCCMKHRLIIESDGRIHEELKEVDTMRDDLLKTGGSGL